MVKCWQYVLALVLGAGACSDAEQAGAPFVRVGGATRCTTRASECLNETATTFEAAGIRVIHSRLPGDPFVAAHVLFEPRSALRDAGSAYAMDLTLMVIRRWGSELHLQTWDEELADVGAQHWAVATPDYAHVGILLPAVHFDAGFSLLADAVLNPPIEALSDERLLSQVVDVYRHQNSIESKDAPVLAADAALRLIAQGHPYATRASSLQVLSALGVSDLRETWRELIQTENLTIVVVGDIEHDDVERVIARDFGALAARQPTQYDGAPLPMLRAGHQLAEVVPYPQSPTSHIVGFMPAPAATDQAEFAALRLGARVLLKRLFNEVRTRLGLAYDVSLAVANTRANYASLQLSSRSPKAAMDAVREVTKRLLRDGIEPEELEAARATYTTSFYLESDGAYRQAITLGDWQLTSGDRELITSHLAAIDAVSAQDARAALAAALPGLRFGAAGPDADAEAAALLGAEGGDECVLACQCRNGDPGVEESCNGSDDDCDGRIDEGTLNACDACGATPGEQCDGVDNDCDGQIDESLSKNACGHCGPVTALNCPQHHTVFVSSVVFAATFGSIENADRECQQLAEKAGRAGTWRALLADDQHPLSLQVPITAPVFNTRDELVAESGSDFFFSRTQKPIDTSESGKRLQDTLAWVGSQTEHCARWTSGSREVTGAQSSSTSGYWLVDARPGPCDTRHSLYCVDQF